MSSPPSSSKVYQPFLGQAGTTPPISFPLSPPFPSGSEDEDNREGRTMLAQQVAARQESQEHEERDGNGDTRSEEGNEEVRANDPENVGEEGEDQINGGPFSPLAVEYTGDPPQHFEFWQPEGAGGPHLPQRAQTGPRPYQGRVETDGDDEVNADKEAKSNDGLNDKVDDDNGQGDDDKKEVANSNDQVHGNTQADDNDNNEEAGKSSNEVDDNTQADDDKNEAAIKEKVKSCDQQASRAPENANEFTNCSNDNGACIPREID